MLEQLEEQFTKYEIARILGARSLQIAMDAPLLLKIDEAELERISYNPIEIAKKELLAGVLPITVNRPLPKRKEGKLKKLTEEEIEAIKKREKEKEEAKENVAGKVEEAVAPAEEKEEAVEEGAEILELSNPEDESEDSGSTGEEEGI